MPRRRPKSDPPKEERPTATPPNGTPYGAGCEAGVAIRRLMASREDRATSLVEWYRGFCNGAWMMPLPGAEASIRQKAPFTDAPVHTALMSARHLNRERGGLMPTQRIVLVGRSLVPDGPAFKHHQFNASHWAESQPGESLLHVFKVEHPTQVELIIALGGCSIDWVKSAGLTIYPAGPWPSYDCDYPLELVAGHSHILLGNGFVLQPAFVLEIKATCLVFDLALVWKHHDDQKDKAPETRKSVAPGQGSSEGAGNPGQGSSEGAGNFGQGSSASHGDPSQIEDAGQRPSSRKGKANG